MDLNCEKMPGQPYALVDWWYSCAGDALGLVKEKGFADVRFHASCILIDLNIKHRSIQSIERVWNLLGM